MKPFKPVLLTLVFIFFYTTIWAQDIKVENDTTQIYLLKKYKELLKPHSDLNFSFGSNELKNEVPDLKVEKPDLKDTAKYFEELKGDYKDWYTFYKIGKLYQKFNKNQSAFAHYEQAYNLIFNQIKKDSLNAKYYSQMGMLYMNLKSNDNAFYFFNKAYELDEKDSLACQFLPMFQIFSGRMEDAENIIQKSIENKTDDLTTYIWMVTATVFKTLGNMDKTDSELLNKTIDELFDFSAINNAVKANKSDIRFLVLEQLSRQLALFAKYGILAGDFDGVGVTADDKKELKVIRKSLEKFLSKGKFKNKYILYKALGFNHLLSKDLEGSIEMFEKAITFWPADQSSKDYHILFATRYFLQNDTLNALKVIDKKIKNDSILLQTNVTDYVLKAHIYLAKNEYENAKYWYQGSLGIAQTPDAWLGLSYLKAKDMKLREANELINKAYDLNKEYYLTYALFGIITLLNNQKEEAKNAIEKAMKLKPNEKILEEVYGLFD
jgi:tetratricopeptide (TPR) repeat protein